MKILSSAQLREWDRYTLKREGIASIQLMERAARACSDYLLSRWRFRTFAVFAGPGNNGGDGLAIARLLKEAGSEVTVYHVYSDGLSEDCRQNLEQLFQYDIPYTRLYKEQEFSVSFSPGTVVIDALLGTGISRPPTGIMARAIEAVNEIDATVVSVDIPTGLYADRPLDHGSVVRARYTLSFQVPKLAFFMPENDGFVGDWTLLDIGLHRDYPAGISTSYSITEQREISELIKPRPRFSHKGTQGTALLMAGCKGMMGAAVLASRACLRSGAGKVYAHIPVCGLDIVQIAAPEVICSIDRGTENLEQIPPLLAKCSSVGIGPGIGLGDQTRSMLSGLLGELGQSKIPVVLDADALNIIAEEGWQEQIPRGAVLTPHLLEFSRLYGPSDNHFSRLEKALEVSHRLGIFILLKGKYSFLSTPEGYGWFNSTGNPGMAKAGTGDVLMGLLTGILAQKYSTVAASRVAVYLHGMAGDMAEQAHSEQAMTASDLIEKIGICYRKVFSI